MSNIQTNIFLQVQPLKTSKDLRETLHNVSTKFQSGDIKTSEAFRLGLKTLLFSSRDVVSSSGNFFLKCSLSVVDFRWKELSEVAANEGEKTWQSIKSLALPFLVFAGIFLPHKIYPYLNFEIYELPYETELRGYQSLLGQKEKEIQAMHEISITAKGQLQDLEKHREDLQQQLFQLENEKSQQNIEFSKKRCENETERSTQNKIIDITEFKYQSILQMLKKLDSELKKLRDRNNKLETTLKNLFTEHQKEKNRGIKLAKLCLKQKEDLEVSEQTNALFEAEISQSFKDLQKEKDENKKINGQMKKVFSDKRELEKQMARLSEKKSSEILYKRTARVDYPNLLREKEDLKSSAQELAREVLELREGNQWYQEQCDILNRENQKLTRQLKTSNLKFSMPNIPTTKKRGFHEF